MEQVSSLSQIGFTLGVSEEPVVTDSVEARRQDMEQEAADELVGLERHRFPTIAVLGSVVLVSEGNAAFIERDESSVGDGDAMGIAGEIGQDGLRPCERRPDIGHPFDLSQWS